MYLKNLMFMECAPPVYNLVVTGQKFLLVQNKLYEFIREEKDDER